MDPARGPYGAAGHRPVPVRVHGPRARGPPWRLAHRLCPAGALTSSGKSISSSSALHPLGPKCAGREELARGAGPKPPRAGKVSGDGHPSMRVAGTFSSLKSTSGDAGLVVGDVGGRDATDVRHAIPWRPPLMASPAIPCPAGRQTGFSGIRLSGRGPCCIALIGDRPTAKGDPARATASNPARTVPDGALVVPAPPATELIRTWM